MKNPNLNIDKMMILHKHDQGSWFLIHTNHANQLEDWLKDGWGIATRYKLLLLLVNMQFFMSKHNWSKNQKHAQIFKTYCCLPYDTFPNKSPNHVVHFYGKNTLVLPWWRRWKLCHCVKVMPWIKWRKENTTMWMSEPPQSPNYKIPSETAFGIVLRMVQGWPYDWNGYVQVTYKTFCKKVHINQFLCH